MTEWWWQVLTFAGTAGVVTAVLNQVFGAAAYWWRTRGLAKHLALRVAVQLETFVDGCAERAADLEVHFDSHGTHGEAWTSVPDFPSLPGGDDEWRALTFDLTERCLSFPHRIREAKGFISFMHEPGPDNGPELRAALERNLRLGIDGGIIATDLRHRYDWPALPATARSLGWMRKSLAKAVEDAQKRERDEAVHLPSPPSEGG